MGMIDIIPKQWNGFSFIDKIVSSLYCTNIFCVIVKIRMVQRKIQNIIEVKNVDLKSIPSHGMSPWNQIASKNKFKLLVEMGMIRNIRAERKKSNNSNSPKNWPLTVFFKIILVSYMLIASANIFKSI